MPRMDATRREGRGAVVGEVAPEFALPDAGGSVVRLSDYRGKSPVVVYFYPGDFTPGCTLEACAFRDAYEDFTDAGAVVIGISGDSAPRHAAFASRHRLPFILLSDERGEAREAYGVGRTLGLLPGRVTFVIDREGVLRHTFSSQLRPRAHIKEALRAIGGLGG